MGMFGREDVEQAKVEGAAVGKAETVDKLTTILEQLVATSRQQGLSADQLETLLTRVGMTSAEAMRLSLKPENAEPTNISAYFTKQDMAKYGSFDQKPRLSRKTYFCGAQEREDRLTPAEIEAYNAITENRDARNGQWKADVKKVGRDEILDVMVPYSTVSERMELPSLLLILMELNGGPSTANIHNLLNQITALKNLASQRGASAADLEQAMLVES